MQHSFQVTAHFGVTTFNLPLISNLEAFLLSLIIFMGGYCIMIVMIFIEKHLGVYRLL